MMVAMMVMMTVCCKSGARTKDNHGEQQSFFHIFILAIAHAVSDNFWVTPAYQEKSSIGPVTVPRLCRVRKKKIRVISR
jgi:hypothetical protein